MQTVTRVYWEVEINGWASCGDDEPCGQYWAVWNMDFGIYLPDLYNPQHTREQAEQHATNA